MLLLPSIDLIFVLKVSPLKCRLLPKFGPEIIPKCFRYLVWFISIIKIGFIVYLSKHNRNTFLFTQHSTKKAAPKLTISLSLNMTVIKWTWIGWTSDLKCPLKRVSIGLIIMYRGQAGTYIQDVLKTKFSDVMCRYICI